MTSITGRPKDVKRDVKHKIMDIIEDDDVDEFYIGRTVDLDKTLSRHGADDIFPVYETESVDYAIEMEDRMIDKFYDHEKCNNKQDHGGGGVSDNYRYYVYVAVWYEDDLLEQWQKLVPKIAILTFATVAPGHDQAPKSLRRNHPLVSPFVRFLAQRVSPTEGRVLRWVLPLDGSLISRSDPPGQTEPSRFGMTQLGSFNPKGFSPSGLRESKGYKNRDLRGLVWGGFVQRCGGGLCNSFGGLPPVWRGSIMPLRHSPASGAGTQSSSNMDQGRPPCWRKSSQASR
jgi:hypothetical protein